MQVFGVLFLAALKIGAPVVGAIFLTDVSLGILARTVPQLNVFVVGLPAKLTVGMLAVFAVLPMAFAVMDGLFGGLEHDLVQTAQVYGWLRWPLEDKTEAPTPRKRQDARHGRPGRAQCGAQLRDGV